MGESRDDTVVIVFEVGDAEIKGITKDGEIIWWYSPHDIQVGEFLNLVDGGGFWEEYKTRATLADFVAGKPAWEQ